MKSFAKKSLPLSLSRLGLERAFQGNQPFSRPENLAMTKMLQSANIVLYILLGFPPIRNGPEGQKDLAYIGHSLLAFRAEKEIKKWSVQGKLQG